MIKDIQKVRLITRFETNGYKTEKDLIRAIKELINHKESFEVDYED